MTKILYTVPHWLWDLISHLWVINSLSEHYKCKIDILSSNKKIDFIRNYNQNIWNILSIDITYTYRWYIKYFLLYFIKDLLKIKKINYDYIISSNQNLVRKIIIFFAKAKNKTYLNMKGHNVLQEYKILDLLKVHYSNSNFLSCSNPLSKRLNTSKYIVINMFCINSDTQKYNSLRDWIWWESLITALIKENFTITLVWQTKLDYSTLLLNNFQNNQVFDLINKTSIDDLINIISSSDLVITIDSFIFHLTYALNQKVLWFFWPASPLERIPPMYINHPNVNYIYKNIYCSPCMKNTTTSCRNWKSPNLCMKSIHISEVIEKIKNIL